MAEIYNSINPNKIKIDYSSNGNSNDLTYNSNFLNVNTWYFGIDVNRNYGPSSKSGWYQGIDALTIDDGLYTIYYTGSTTGRTNNVNDYYRCVQYSDTQDVINFVNSQAGFSVADFPEALNWFKHDASAGNGTSGRGGGGSNVCVNMNYPNIPTSGLTFALDAGHVASYPRMNSTWFDFAQSAMSGFSGNSRVIQHFDETNSFFNFIDAGTGFEYFISSKGANLGTDFTIIFWGSPNVVVDNQEHFTFSFRKDNTNSGGVGYVDNKTNVKFYYNVKDSLGAVKTRTGTINYHGGTWAQFSYVFETNNSGTTTSSFYYNDTLSEQNDETFLIQDWDNTTGTANWYIGTNPINPILQFNYYGGMQILLVYNRALSATEIADIYQNYFDTRGLFA
jgi:hypothetical protein